MKNIIEHATNKFQVDKDYWADNYRKAREDIKFLSDDKYAQWDERALNDRLNSNRPALTIDQLNQFVHQVVNDVRINTPTISVIPSGFDGDEKTAEIYKGLIRNIEYVSDADSAYDKAIDDSVRCGLGFVRVDHDYVDDKSFEQHLLIKRVVNPLNIFLDSNSVEIDGRDAKHCTIIDNISVDEFKKKYPKFEPVCFENSDLQLENSEDKICIAEFFHIEEKEKEIGIDKFGNIQDVSSGGEFVKTRTVKEKTVYRYLLSGNDILEKTIFPGKYIPIIPVYGEELWESGKRTTLSLIRKSKDAQKMFNYWKSLETELLMKQPQAPVLAAEGQIEDYIEDWVEPDKAMVLRYKQTDLEGNPAPLPQRLSPPTVPTGVVNASRQTVDDIKATMGMYGASLGQKTNETSGVAISERRLEGDIATYHFGDNLTKSITHVGRVIVSAIPSIYDTPRVLRIIGEEEEPKKVGVNGQMIDEQEETFNLTEGQYDVKVITGAPFTTRRQEAAKFFTDIVTRQPELMQIMGDLLFKYMDFTGAPAMAERMKKVIDPKFLEENENDETQQQIQAIQQESQTVIQGLQAEIEQLTKQLEDKQLDAQIKAKTVMTKAEADKANNEIKMLELQLKEKEARFDAEVKLAELKLKEKELQIKEEEIEAKIHLEIAKNDMEVDKMICEKELEHDNMPNMLDDESALIEERKEEDDGK